MISMKIATPYTKDAYEAVCRLKGVEDYFQLAKIDYTLGQKTDYSNSDSWPLKFYRLRRDGKKVAVLKIAAATAGYVGAGSILTYDILKALGFNPSEDEIFKSDGKSVVLEYHK